MAVVASEILVQVGGDTSPLRKDLKKANKSLDNLSSNVLSTSKKIAKMGAVSATAGAAMVAALYNNQRQVIDSLAKTADALGITTENLQALQHLAGLAGVETKALNNSLQKMSKNLGEAARKGGIAAQALGDVGLNIEDIVDLEPDKQLIELSKAFSQVENQTVKASIASDLFGRNGLKMLKVMDQLKQEGLDPTVKAIKEMGASLSRIDAAKVEEANDAMEKAGVAASAMANVMTVALAPIVSSVANKFVEWSKSTGGVINKIKNLKPLIEDLAIVAGGLAAIFGANLVSAMAKYAIAQTTMIRNTIVQSTTMTRLGAVSKALRATLALLGGPVGVITLAATAIGIWAFKAKEAQAPTKTITGLVDDLAESYGKMTDKAKAAALVDLNRQIIALQNQKKIQREIVEEYEKGLKVFDEVLVSLEQAKKEYGDSRSINRRIERSLGQQLAYKKEYGGAATKALAKEEQIAAQIQKAVDLQEQLNAKKTASKKDGKSSDAITGEEQTNISSSLAEKESKYQEHFNRMRDMYGQHDLERNKSLQLSLFFGNRHKEDMESRADAYKKYSASFIESTEEMAAAEARNLANRQAMMMDTSKAFGNLSSLMSSENKKQFEFGKKAAKAQAVIDTYAAAQASYKSAAGWGGPLAGAAAAAAALVAGFSRVRAINSTTFGGGGGGSSAGAGGGGSVSAPAQPQQQQQSGTLTVQGIDQGKFYSGDSVAEMAAALVAYQEDGGKVVIV